MPARPPRTFVPSVLSSSFVLGTAGGLALLAAALSGGARESLLLVGLLVALGLLQALERVRLAHALGALALLAALGLVPRLTPTAQAACIVALAGLLLRGWVRTPLPEFLAAALGAATGIGAILHLSVEAGAARSLDLAAVTLGLGAITLWLLRPLLLHASASRTGGLSQVAIALQAGIALLVLLGWSLGAAEVVRGATARVPMQFNTAVCHLFAALALWCALRGQARAAGFALLPVVLFTLPSLLVESTGWDLGVDEILFPHPFVAEGVPPGRMALNTAIGFLIAAAGTLLVAQAGARRRHWVAVWIYGFAVTTIAVVVLAGYLLDVPQARAWAGQTPMALLTAFAFSGSGIALMFAGREHTGGNVHLRFWLPILIAMGALVFAMQLWMALAEQQQHRTREAAELRADTLQRGIEARLQVSVDSLDRLAQRIASLDEDGRERLFSIDAPAYLRHFPSLNGLAWVDASLRLHRIASPDPKLRALEGSAADFDEARRVAYAEAGARGRPRLSAPVALADGSPGEVLVVPVVLRETDAVTGFISAGVNFQRLFDELLQGEPGSLRIRDGDVEIYARGEWPADADIVSRRLQRFGRPWDIELALSVPPLGRLVWALLIGTLIAGGWLAMAIRYAALSRERAAQADAHRAALQAQYAESDRMRTALDASERELGGVLASITDAFYLLDADWRFVFLNPRAEALMQRPSAALLGKVVWDEFPDAARGVVRETFERALAEQSSLTDEVHFEALQAWFEFRVYPHHRGLAVYFHDITHSKQNQNERERLQRESERAQALARLGSWELDLSTGRYAWSDASRRMLGFPDDVSGGALSSLLEQVHAEDRALVSDMHDRLLAGKSIDLEFRVLIDGRRLRHLHAIGESVPGSVAGPRVASGALQDITERRQADEALREAARRLEWALVQNRRILDHSLDVICAIDANGRFGEVSPACRRIWGYAPNELATRPWSDFVHPDDREATQALLEALQRGDAVTDFRNRHRRRDGSECVMQWSASWSEAAQQVFAVARDVTRTELHEAELLALRDSLLRAQAIAHLGSWELDIPAARLTWSDEIYRIFGLDPARFTPDFESFLQRVHADDRPRLLAAQEQALRGEADLDLEHRIVLPDGGIRHVHERARLLRDAHGQAARLSGSVQDITARKLGERALEKERVFLRALLESLAEGVVACDAEGTLTTFNHSMRQFHGLPEAPIPPEQWPEHYQIHEMDGSVMKAERLPLVRALRGERVVDSEAEIRARGRPPRIVLCSGQPILDDAGEKLGAVIAAHDVTQRRLAERVQADQQAILAGIAARAPLAQSLDALARLHETQFEGGLCSVLLLDDSGERVVSAAAPSLPASFTQAVDRQPIGPAAGSCGTAVWRGERVVTEDIASDPLWGDYAALALAHDLRACWSTPVKSSSGKVLATFAVYYPTKRAPTEAELQSVDRLASLAAIAIEQGLAYRRLTLSEQRFRSLFDEHPDAVYSMDLAGRFTACNAGFERLVGRTRAETLGEFFDRGIEPAQQAFVREQFSAAARGEARSYETRALFPGERVADLRITNLPIVIAGEVTGVFGVAHDITLLRERERELAAALRRTEASSSQLRRMNEAAVIINRSSAGADLFQALVDLLRDTIGAHQSLLMVMGMDGAESGLFAVSLSDKYEAYRNYRAPPDGSGIYAVVTETRSPARMDQAMLEAHPRWRAFGAEAGRHPPMRGWLAVPLIAADGRALGTLQLSDKYEGEFNADDEAIAAQFAQMASSAIERAALIDRLRERDRFFKLSHEIFVIFDPATRRFSQVNPMFCEVTGYSAEELCARVYLDFVHPEDREDAQRRLSEARSLEDDEPELRTFRNRYVCRDGSIRWIEWASVRTPDGFEYGVGRDISERVDTDRELARTLEDLANRNRELQDFAFVASHDLQEPLRKIRTFSDRMLSRHAQQLDEAGRDYLQRTVQAAARMQSLINDLLAYSRVNARGRPFEPVDLQLVANEVLVDLEDRIESSGGQVELGTLPTLEGDATQLRQLLQNLIANALKFRHPDRAPHVRIFATPARLEGGREGFSIDVTDNGIGFDERYAEKIFAPFQRLHGRHEFEGTGIGLAIVRRIVEHHRGTIRAEGRPEEGARFRVLLPARQTDGSNPFTGAPSLDD